LSDQDLSQDVDMIPYDASSIALVHPAGMPTVLDASSLTAKPREAIYVECARLAYFQFELAGPQADQWRAALGLLNAADIAWFSDADTGTQAYAFVLDGKEAVIAFRGTEPDSIADLAADIDTKPRDWAARAGVAGGQVHTGFAEAFESLVAEEAFQDWFQRNARLDLVLVGHSLGAALATLGASRWNASRLVTIGSPRVGDAEFAASIAADRVTRYVDCCDVITTVPPALGVFTHVGAESYIDRNGHLTSGLSASAIEADRDAARDAYGDTYRWVFGNVFFRGLADHAPVNYLRPWF
jgi:hypothetical protein